MALTRGIRRPEQLDATMSRAAQLYARKGLNFTPLRQEVFQVIARSEAVVGAYDVLRQMQHQGRKVSPISVYRALSSLLDAGVVRRLRSNSTYFPSYAVLGRGRLSEVQTVYVVCQLCHRAAEVVCPGAHDAMMLAAKRATFPLSATYMEAAGLCESCARRNNPTVSVRSRRETAALEFAAFD
jgi:Fur family zinc uptake transcriptional regulator